jgi:AcrR family transcriptional regulator
MNSISQYLPMTQGNDPSAEASLSGAEQRRREAALRKKERILEAAAFLFAEQGFTKTTVDEIAREASISKGLVYVHFPSKDDLLEAVLMKASTEWFQAIRAEKSGPSPSVPERVANTLRASFHYAQANPILRAILAQDPRLLLPRRKNVNDPILEKYRADLEQLLRLGMERTEVRSNLDPKHTAESIVLLHSALILELFVASTLRPSELQENLVEATIALILNGIQT